MMFDPLPFHLRLSEKHKEDHPQLPQQVVFILFQGLNQGMVSQNWSKIVTILSITLLHYNKHCSNYEDNKTLKDCDQYKSWPCCLVDSGRLNGRRTGRALFTHRGSQRGGGGRDSENKACILFTLLIGFLWDLP